MSCNSVMFWLTIPISSVTWRWFRCLPFLSNLAFWKDFLTLEWIIWEDGIPLPGSPFYWDFIRFDVTCDVNSDCCVIYLFEYFLCLESIHAFFMPFKIEINWFIVFVEFFDQYTDRLYMFYDAVAFMKSSLLWDLISTSFVRILVRSLNVWENKLMEW